MGVVLPFAMVEMGWSSNGRDPMEVTCHRLGYMNFIIFLMKLWDNWGPKDGKEPLESCEEQRCHHGGPQIEVHVAKIGHFT